MDSAIVGQCAQILDIPTDILDIRLRKATLQSMMADGKEKDECLPLVLELMEKIQKDPAAK